MEINTIAGYQAAITLFSQIPGWLDADELIVTCNRIINESYAIEEQMRRERARIAKRNRIIALIVAAIVCAVIAFIVLLNTVIVPNGKYNAALKLMDDERYGEAMYAFKALDGYKDADVKVQECRTAIRDEKYDAALELMNAGRYEDAITAFKALDGHKDSDAKVEACETAILDERYEAALELMSAGKYEDAIAAFKALDDHRDAKSLSAKCTELVAQLEFDQGNFAKAVKLLEDSDSFYATNGLYIQACLAEAKRIISNRELNAPFYIEKIPLNGNTRSLLYDIKYEYILAHRDWANTYTRTYLKELKAAGYKDCDQIWDELYTWKVTLKDGKTTSDGLTSSLSYLPTSSSYLSMYFYLTGGEPGEKITIYYKVQWPGDAEYRSGNYTSMTHGKTFSYVLVRGYTSSSGTLVIKFYNAADNSCIGSVSIPVEKPIEESDYETSGRVTLSNSGYYVTSSSQLHTNSAGIQKYQLLLSSSKSDALIFNIKSNSDGTYSFVTDDGHYLLADGTDVRLVTTDSDDTKFIFEADDNGLMIRCFTATYDGNAQYLETYMGVLTCYGLQESHISDFYFLTEPA